MEKSFSEVYELFKIRCSNGNILESYYPFLASVILESGMEQVNDIDVRSAFEEKYSIPITLPFIRQVLSVGIENRSIVNVKGEYIADMAKLREYKLPENDFEKNWQKLKKEYDKYCRENDLKIVDSDIFESQVLYFVDAYSYKFIVDNEWSGDDEVAELDYYWYKFVQVLPQRNPEAFDFLAQLSASNTYREALFVSKKEDARIGELNIYLDSPMVFALLGMDSAERCEEYRELIEKIQASGCKVMILDNNLDEVTGIINRASTWATSSAYDISKANKVAKYFHDSGMSRAEILEFCSKLEEKLNDLGILIKQTSYDSTENSFQEDENTLFDMVKSKYFESNMALTPEKEESIKCDVKSIIMVYRLRKGRVAAKINTCEELMLTRNAALANVCKQYEAQKSLKAGHIPACISADLFGAILWLNSPMDNVEYQKKKILADCYASLRPNKELLKRYVESLESARKMGEIDDRKYLMMRSNTIVIDALMNVTKGDYARFNDRTYIEVYEEIEAIAQKDYRDEKEAHEKTRQELSESKEKVTIAEEKSQELQAIIDEKNQAYLDKFDRIGDALGNIIAVIICVIPSALVFIGGEFVKARYAATFSFVNACIITGILIAASIMAALHAKLKAFCQLKAQKIVKDKLYEPFNQ